MTENVTRECPFEDCDWSYENDRDYDGELSADHKATMHYEREHAGEIEIQVTLTRKQLLGPRDPKDIRERFLDEDFGAWEISHVRTEVLEEADDHSKTQREQEELEA